MYDPSVKDILLFLTLLRNSISPFPSSSVTGLEGQTGSLPKEQSEIALIYFGILPALKKLLNSIAMDSIKR